MRILFVEYNEKPLLKFRKELVSELINNGHELFLCFSNDKDISNIFDGEKTKIYDVKMDLRDKGLFSNIKLVRSYKRIINEVKPDIILSFAIKPNLYCGYLSKKVPIIANITGLGAMFSTKNLLYKLGVFLYRRSFKNVDCVFFQNEDGVTFFKQNKIKLNNFEVIPGSGVNSEKFVNCSPYHHGGTINFLFASRPISEKGFYYFIQSIPELVKENKNVRFIMMCNGKDINEDIHCKEIFENYGDFIEVLPETEDMVSVYNKADFVVSPSYYREGISNVLLESLSCERPIITTNDNYGCKEVLQEGKNGFGVKSKDLNSLVEAMKKASKLSLDEIKQMGQYGRKFVQEKFERKLMINYYLRKINELIKKDE